MICFGPSIKKKTQRKLNIYLKKKTVVEAFRLTAMQNITQRGHVETKASQNKGNCARNNLLITKEKKV